MEGSRVLCAILTVLLVVAIYLLLRAGWKRGARHKFHIKQARPVRASADGEKYQVHLHHAHPAKAANKLANLQDWCLNVIQHMRDKYLRGDLRGAYPQRATMARKILERYDPDRLYESSPKNPDNDTAFTINKGEIFALCLREKDPTRTGDPALHDFHDMVTLKFVATHELAHLGVDSYGHPPEFWSCFKLLLLESNEMVGGWPNYQQRPIQYCGLLVDYNPLYDPDVLVPH